jgi:S1-C subfamily serine protease
LWVRVGRCPDQARARGAWQDASALVEVSGIQGDATGSAFCVEKSDLFVTNAQVAAGADAKVGRVRLVIDSGLASQRILPAKVVRLDDEIDLALLQVNASSGLTPLELGQDAGLVELAEGHDVSNRGKPRTYSAEPVRDGLFTATVIPDQEVYLVRRDIDEWSCRSLFLPTELLQGPYDNCLISRG